MAAPPPPIDAVRAELDRLGASVDDAALSAFLAESDAGYFERVQPAEVARHASMAASLSAQRRARVEVTPRTRGRYDVAVVAYDCFAELALVCGLLASRGLDVESGHAHTLTPAAPRPVPGRRPVAAPRRIVDVFRVRPRTGLAPDGPALERELCALLDLVAAGRPVEARERVQLALVEAFEASDVPRGAAGPVEIRFAERGPAVTTIEVGGSDAPGFLYALANALAMRGVYVHDVRIVSERDAVRDVFRISRADGGALAEEELAALRQAVELIRHFTYLLPGAPDPARALRYFDQLLDRTAGQPAALEAFGTSEALADLARFLGSSAFLWEDLVRDRLDRALPVLAGWRARPLRGRAELRADLRARLPAGTAAFRELRDEETLLIETRRLLDPGLDLERFSWALSDLGEALVAEALRDAWEGVGSAGDHPVAALALGKFGGREMGHASDLELLFVHGEVPPGADERVFDEVVRATLLRLEVPEGGLFHVDLRLRPHGSRGALATPLGALREYYRPGGDAAAFERQALVKLRFVAGHERLGREAEQVRDAFVWSGAPWDREASLRLRERQARELVPRGRFNVKLSRGGLVDAEYAVQYLQVVHGHALPELRTPATLAALDRLATLALVEPSEHEVLREGYLFWREVADALRIVRGHAGDLLLPETGTDDYGFLARRLGYPGGRGPAAAALARDVALFRDRLRALFDRRFA